MGLPQKLTTDGRPQIAEKRPRTADGSRFSSIGSTFPQKKPRSSPPSAEKDLRGLLVIFFFTLRASARFRFCPFSTP